jgi:23S rRNA pseudouridine1911/1915/1917 synthase
MDVLFCDNHLLIVRKPAGIPTQPDGKEILSLEEQAKLWVKTSFNKPGNVFLEAIHRLDKPVEGIVIFARTSKALSRMNAFMREGKIDKVYHAWVEGAPKTKEGVLEHYLSHESFHAKVVDASHPQGKKAILSFKTLSHEKGRSLLEITLHTGRYHQIRAQLAAIGCPILGDQKYGSSLPYEKGQIGLKNVQIKCPHPVSTSILEMV